MDYIKNIEDAVKAFESETKKLSNYTNLLGTIKGLIEAIQSEKDILNKSTEEIKKAEEPILSSCKALSELCEKLKQIIDKEQLDNKSIKDELAAILNDYLDKETASREESVDIINKTAVKMTSSVAVSNKKIIEAVNTETDRIKKQIGSIFISVNESIVKKVDSINENIDARGMDVKNEFETFTKKLEIQADKQVGLQNSLDNLSGVIDGNNKEIASIKMLCISAIAVGIFNIIVLFMLR